MDVAALLQELNASRTRKNPLPLDTSACNQGEFLVYASGLTFTGLATLVHIVLACRNCIRDIYFATMAVPCAIYMLVFAGLLGACVDTGLSQEEPLLITLAAVQPLVCLHFLRLVRDARRKGLNARVFVTPLTRRGWKWLGIATGFHLLLLLLGVGMLVHLKMGFGSPMVATEAMMLLRTVRERDVTCSPWDVLASGSLAGAAWFVGPLGTIVLRKFARRYAFHWARGVGLPHVWTIIVNVCTLAACLDQDRPQEEPAYLALTAVSGVAALQAAYLANKYATGWGAKERWLYLAVLPYWVMCCLAALTCFVWLQMEGPLLAESFVPLWERLLNVTERVGASAPPPPPSAEAAAAAEAAANASNVSNATDGDAAGSIILIANRTSRGVTGPVLFIASGQHAPLIFLPCVFIYLAAVFSTLVWDPDESEKEAIAPKKGRRRRKKAADDGDGDGGGEAAGVVGAAAGSRLARLRNRLPTKLARLASDSKKTAAAGTQVSRL